MPLVVPGITNNLSASGQSQFDWMNKLAGKKLGDVHNETVCVAQHGPTRKMLNNVVVELCAKRFA